MFRRRKQFVVNTLTHSNPTKLNDLTAKDMQKMAKQGYVFQQMTDENINFLGVTTSQIRTVVYRLDVNQ